MDANLYKISTWVGYIGCVYSVCCLLWYTQLWFVTIHLYGRITWGHALQMLRFVAKSPHAHHLYGPLVPLLVAGGFYFLKGIVFPSSFILSMVLFQIQTYVYQSTPPAVLLLGKSRLESISLRESLERGVLPYRIVALFDSSDISPSASGFQRNLLEWDDLRVVRGNQWRSIVHSLMDTVPIVVIDTRIASAAVNEETERILSSPALIQRAVFIVGPNGESQVLTAVGAVSRVSELQTVQEEQLVPFLKQLGLSRTTSPDDDPILSRIFRE